MKASGRMRVALAVAAWAVAGPAAAGESARQRAGEVKGFAEYRKQDVLIVDGQRVRLTPHTSFKGLAAGETLSLGHEVKAKGTWQPDGALLAERVDVKPNRRDKGEEDLLAKCNEIEKLYLQAGRAMRVDGEGSVTSLGAIADSGREHARARRILDRLLPPYVAKEDVRLYVVQNEDWNAFAMANLAIYVHAGLLRDLDDDEVAIVLGHELAHATLEHTRRTMRKGRWGRLLRGVASVGAAFVGGLEGDAIVGLTGLGASALNNGFSRGFEDQADRVGMRYAYEGGFDVRKAARLWRRFGEKYGDQSGVTNFFFGSHSQSKDRAKNLEVEVAKNYAAGVNDPPSRSR